MPAATQTRKVEINKSEKKDTVQNESQSVFLPTWESHSRLLTNLHHTPNDIWPITSDSFYKTITCNNDSLVHIRNEGDAFQVIVESADFKPGELKVSTVNENVLKIEGHIEESSPNN